MKGSGTEDGLSLRRDASENRKVEIVVEKHRFKQQVFPPSLQTEPWSPTEDAAGARGNKTQEMIYESGFRDGAA